MRWLRNENDDLFDPGYSGHVACGLHQQVYQGRLSDLVGLLSGRNFETRTYEKRLKRHHFARFVKAF